MKKKLIRKISEQLANTKRRVKESKDEIKYHKEQIAEMKTVLKALKK